jgi:Heavy-metal-associated domain
VSVAVKKLDGVESVDVSLEKASAVIVLKADNTITLPQLRKIIRNAGYPTKDARLLARGSIVERGGKAMLDLLNGSVLELSERPKELPPGVVEITGVSRAGKKDAERLTLTTVPR